MSAHEHTRWEAWRLGVAEGAAGLSTGVTYDDDPSSPRSDAYDRGRTYGEELAGRPPPELERLEPGPSREETTP
jgi:hypothetical protein